MRPRPDPNDTPLQSVRLDRPLPCATPGCGQSADMALVEPAAQHAGAWLALPLCSACRRRIAGVGDTKPRGVGQP